MIVLSNVYNVLSVYFRTNDKFNIINVQDFENRNIGLGKDFYDCFYNYLNYI